MRSSTIVLAAGLLAVPVALFANPQNARMQAGLMQLAQYSTGAPAETVNGRPLADAPIPDPPAHVAPVDRVAGPGAREAGPIDATPFSAGPTSAMAAGSPGSPNGTPGGDATPNLGR